MKRKLNADDVPEAVDEEAESQKQPSFSDIPLDARLHQAIAKEGFSKPTSVQARSIPLALKGANVLARAKTGTGKTAAYLLPVLQSILSSKSSSSTAKTSALILVPTRELASQVYKVIQRFSTFCSKDVQAINLAPPAAEQAQRAQLAANPDIVIATPARARLHAERKNLEVEGLRWVVVDEADLVMSYGYEEDFRALVDLLPKQGVQAFLASATLTTEVDELKALFCQNPKVVDLQEEEQKEQATVSQYVIKCGEDQKFLILVALFKIPYIRGKCIVFAGDVDRCYRVKMVLEQFGVRSCVLNSELPVNSRLHVVEEFNKGIYDIIIATDESDAAPSQSLSEVDGSTSAAPNVASNGEDSAAIVPNGGSGKPNKKQRRSKKDANFGISRGIDFQHVTCVLNFDLPISAKAYTHMIGRTGRLGQAGSAISFVIPASEYRKHTLLSYPSTKHDEAVLVAIQAAQEKRGNQVIDFPPNMPQIEALSYRVSSALKVVTLGAVRQTRLKELREELLKSEKLKRHLEENPEDLKWLRHDQETRSARVQPHLKNLPEYLLPVGATSTNGLKHIGFVGPGRQSENKIRRAHQLNKSRKNPRRRADPLKTFKSRK